MRSDVREFVDYCLSNSKTKEPVPAFGPKVAPGPLPNEFKKVIIEIVLQMEDLHHDSSGEDKNDLIVRIEDWMKALKKCPEISTELRRKEQG